jgi:UDP-glucose 4-epimerase
MDKAQKKTFLITGSSGFLGGHLSTALMPDAHVVAFLRERDPAQSIPNPDGLFHLAAAIQYTGQHTRQLIESNVLLTEHILGLFNTTRVIFSSTVSVFEHFNGVIDDNTLPTCSSVYPLSKLWAEALVQQHPSYAIVRFSSIYGSGMKETTFLPRIVNQAINTGEITIWGTGQRKQNYIHVNDALSLLQAAFDNKNNDVFLGTSSESYSNLEVAEIVAGFTGAKIRCIETDYSKSFVYKSGKANDRLGWAAKTGIAEGIKGYIEWKEKQF